MAVSRRTHVAAGATRARGVPVAFSRLTLRRASQTNMEIVIVTEAVMASTSNVLQALQSYRGKEIVHGRRFKNVVKYLPAGHLWIDMSNFDKTIPCPFSTPAFKSSQQSQRTSRQPSTMLDRERDEAHPSSPKGLNGPQSSQQTIPESASGQRLATEPSYALRPVGQT